MPPVAETFNLFLAPWQVRMIKDFLPRVTRKIEKIAIKPGVIRCPASYKIPVEGLRRGDWVLYLTDEQMVIIKEKFQLKTPVSGINITEELIKNRSVAFM